MRNKRVGLYAVALLVAGSGAVQAKSHEFSLKDGRKLKAEIVGYNARLGKVELKREDGKRIPVKPTVFSEADQKYIHAWVMLDGFRNERFFKVDCKRDLVEKWKKEENDEVRYEGGGSETEKMLVSISRFERYVFKLVLENKNDFALENLKVEYRIFYEQERSDGISSKVEVGEQVLAGSLKVKQLKPREKKKLETKPVVLRDTQYSSDISYGASQVTKSRESGELKGIWLKISTPGLDGKPVFREFFEPLSLKGKHEWPSNHEVKTLRLGG